MANDDGLYTKTGIETWAMNVKSVSDSGSSQVVNPDGSTNVVLTGRNVEEVIVQNGLAITTTGFIDSASFDVSMYKSFSLGVLNTLDQSVEVYLLQGGDLLTPGTTFSYNGTTLAEKNVVVPTNGAVRNVLDRTAFNSNDIMPKKIKISLHCAVAPISGSVTIVLWGVPN